MTKSENTNKEISVLLAARNSLFWIVSQEERRVERALQDIAGARKFQVRFWDAAAGMTEFDPDGKLRSLQNVPPGQGADPDAALALIRAQKSRYIYILRDFHKWLANPITLRNLRNLANEIQSCPLPEARAIVILTPVAEVPIELQALATLINYPLPDREEISKLLNDVVSNRKDAIANREQAIDAALGMTSSEIENCFASSLVSVKKIDPALISKEKKRVIERDRLLNWFEPDPRGMDAIGGLANLKSWLNTRKSGFTKEAREYGLPSPHGVLLVGVPGAGKSLTAKCVAASWQMPLLRLDLGALRSKYVGESEQNIRKALQIAETVSPAVCWLDEVEKSLNPSGQGDGGVSSDALGVVLNWMQERTGSVFVIATANDISALPPELLRKGRFDEIFFVGLPTKSERAQILRATLKQYRQTVEIDCDLVANSTKDFTGAEIASLVPEAMFVAFADNKRAITVQDLLEAAKKVVPLAKTAQTKIEALTKWAKSNARSASSEELEEVSELGNRDLDLT